MRRCLDSIQPQLGPGDEVIIVGDVHDGPLPAVEALVRSYGERFRYLAHDAGHHCYGHCALNYAARFATGDYVHVNDDDDVWASDAAESMRSAAEAYPGKPLLFRFKHYLGPVFWHRKGELRRNHVGGHCIVAPRDYFGAFACEYSGDFDMVYSTIMNAGGVDTVVWLDKLICYARPAQA